MMQSVWNNFPDILWSPARFFIMMLKVDSILNNIQADMLWSILLIEWISAGFDRKVHGFWSESFLVFSPFIYIYFCREI